MFPANFVLAIDRGYIDYEWLNNLSKTNFFVTRLKSNTNLEIVEELSVEEKHEHILSDQIIRLTGVEAQKKYPGMLRAVEVYNEENAQILILLTNQLTWTADMISQLYKARWDVEVFFKHPKQLVRVKTFLWGFHLMQCRFKYGGS